MASWHPDPCGLPWAHLSSAYGRPDGSPSPVSRRFAVRRGNPSMQIALRRRDESISGYAIVDAADYPRLTVDRWRLDSRGYASRHVRSNGKLRAVYMHREVLGLAHDDERETDHVNGDRLDNRQSNLRAVTRAQNRQNQPPRSVSGHRNVHWDKRAEKWRVQVGIDGRKIFGGYFDRLHDAAAAAAALRKEHLPFAVEARANRKRPPRRLSPVMEKGGAAGGPDSR